MRKILLKRFLKNLALLFFLAVVVYYELTWLGVYESEYHLTKNMSQSEEFRAMNFGKKGLNDIREFAKKNELNLEDCVTVIMIAHDYDLTDYNEKEYTLKEYQKDSRRLRKTYSDEFYGLRKEYKKIIGDLKYFPVPLKKDNADELVNYTDSWGNERTYGGERRHEGTDIMDNQNKRGSLPVLSMTDGVVENMGWLELGGYRIGIRSESGAYFYYAHLYSYAGGLKEGDSISAGQLIGFMGDTGYSKVEGTTGNFDVHLHVGVYITLENGEDISVNPYYILRSLEGNKTVYDF